LKTKGFDKMKRFPVSKEVIIVAPADKTPGQLLVERLVNLPVDQGAVARLAKHLDLLAPVELYPLQPHKLAAGSNIELGRVLTILAMGVHQGVLDLFWEVDCQECGSPLLTFGNLSEAPQEDVACPVCQTATPVEVDHNLYVYFSLNSAFFKEPSGPGGSFELPAVNTLVKETLDDHLITKKTVPTEFGESSFPPVTALDLMHIQFYQDFFTEQLLPVNMNLKVSRVSLIFTDLRDSTALYARIGDPRAYQLVRQHFDLLKTETLRHNGVMVKTIGDAVMASFKSEVEAVKAAMAFQQTIAQCNRENGAINENALVLKVGLYSGPCLLVNSNDQPDYFGTTVNLAARIAAQSQGNDIMIARKILADEEVQAAIREGGFVANECKMVKLRGLPDQSELCRLIPLN
jgi:class 3 adenylate cyclase